MGHYVKNNASHDNMRIGYVRRSKFYYFSNYTVIIMCNYTPFAHVLWSVVLHKRPGTYHLSLSAFDYFDCRLRLNTEQSLDIYYCD